MPVQVIPPPQGFIEFQRGLSQTINSIGMAFLQSAQLRQAEKDQARIQANLNRNFRLRQQQFAFRQQQAAKGTAPTTIAQQALAEARGDTEAGITQRAQGLLATPEEKAKTAFFAAIKDPDAPLTPNQETQALQLGIGITTDASGATRLGKAPVAPTKRQQDVAAINFAFEQGQIKEPERGLRLADILPGKSPAQRRKLALELQRAEQLAKQYEKPRSLFGEPFDGMSDQGWLHTVGPLFVMTSEETRTLRAEQVRYNTNQQSLRVAQGRLERLNAQKAPDPKAKLDLEESIEDLNNITLPVDRRQFAEAKAIELTKRHRKILFDPNKTDQEKITLLNKEIQRIISGQKTKDPLLADAMAKSLANIMRIRNAFNRANPEQTRKALQSQFRPANISGFPHDAQPFLPLPSTVQEFLKQ